MEIFTFLHQNSSENKTSYLFSYMKYTLNIKTKISKDFLKKCKSISFSMPKGRPRKNWPTFCQVALYSYPCRHSQTHTYFWFGKTSKVTFNKTGPLFLGFI